VKKGKKLVLSMKESDIDNCGDDVEPYQLSSITDYETDQLITAYVRHVDQGGVFVCVDQYLDGHIRLSRVSKYNFNMEQYSQLLPHGKLITCSVCKKQTNKERISLSLLEKDTGIDDIGEEMSEQIVPPSPPPMKKPRIECKTLLRDALVAQIHKAETNLVSDVKVITSDDDGVAPLDEPGFHWDDQDRKDEDQDSGVEDDEPTTKTTASKTVNLKDDIYMTAKEHDSSSLSAPQTTADWERLMVSNPHSSEMWIRYMSFHVHSVNLDQARIVAEKALKTIDFREEAERLNVWVALLSMEVAYGSDEVIEDTLKRALQYNNQLKVYNHMITVYNKANQREKAEELHIKITNKFRIHKEVWVSYMKHVMEDGRFDDARQLLKRCIQSIEKKSHLEMVTKFAQMLFVHGEPDRGCTMFEETAASYPKRPNVWTMYLDALVKAQLFDKARETFDRLFSSSLPSKKMQSFYKRLVDFESKHGNDESLLQAKRKALEFVERQRALLD